MPDRGTKELWHAPEVEILDRWQDALLSRTIESDEF
jgi:hypothetical protein